MIGLVPKKTSQNKSWKFVVEEINNGYLCHEGSDTWFFSNKECLMNYITDLIEDI
jgi:hypothetical protein